jgi:hypothetical protein
VQGNIAAKAEADRLRDVIGQVDDVTAAVKGALEQQNAQNQAYLAATRSAGIFAGMVDTATTALETNANQSAINTVAALHLGAGQTQLQQKLADVDSQFLITSADASAYGSILNAQFGKYQSYSDAVAAFTVSLKEQAKQLTAGKDAVVFTTDAGAKNEQVLSGMAKQNYAVAEALLTQTGSQQQANNALQAGVVQIDAVAKNAGFTKTQIDALNIALYGTKNIGDIKVPISADTAPARQEVAHLLNDINADRGTIQIYATASNPTGGKALGANARGGPFQRGDVSVVGEEGPEIVEFDGPGRVIPNDKIRPYLAAMRSGGTSLGNPTPAAPPATLGGSAGSGGITVIAPVYLDGQLIGRGVTKGARAEVQNFARHNALTGFADNYR